MRAWFLQHQRLCCRCLWHCITLHHALLQCPCRRLPVGAWPLLLLMLCCRFLRHCVTLALVTRLLHCSRAFTSVAAPGRAGG